MKTKTAILLFAALAAVCVHARTVTATWTNTNSTAANVRVDSRTVGDATVANPIWNPWTSTTATVAPGATYEYQSEGWSLVSRPSAQPPYYQLVEVKVYEATLTVESYDPPANRPPTIAWASVPTEVPYTREPGKKYANVKAVATDPDGDRVVVVIWRRVNGGAWISSETKRGAYTDDAVPGARIEWRAMATDARGAESGWIYHGPITVGP